MKLAYIKPNSVKAWYNQKSHRTVEWHGLVVSTYTFINKIHFPKQSKWNLRTFILPFNASAKTSNSSTNHSSDTSACKKNNAIALLWEAAIVIVSREYHESAIHLRHTFSPCKRLLTWSTSWWKNWFWSKGLWVIYRGKPWTTSMMINLRSPKKGTINR